MTIPTKGGSSLPFGFGGGFANSGNDGTTTTAVGPSDQLLLSLSSIAILSLFYALFIFRPRTAKASSGGAAPPVVTQSPVCGVPVVGTIVEFGKSPVKMVQRCFEEYGPVFTVPVSNLLLFVIGHWAGVIGTIIIVIGWQVNK